MNCVIRKVTYSTGIISTFAGSANSCFFSGDGGPPTSAHLYQPGSAIFVDSSGIYYTNAGTFFELLFISYSSRQPVY